MFGESHPFSGDLTNLSMAELMEKTAELYKKRAIAARLGNPVLLQQLDMLIYSYNLRSQELASQEMARIAEQHMSKKEIRAMRAKTQP